MGNLSSSSQPRRNIPARTRPITDRNSGAGEHEPPLVYHEPYGRDISHFATAPLVSREQVEQLKKKWLRNPTWDIEWAVGFECYREELANWHEDQIAVRAQALGCSKLMASIVEELVECWILGRPPRSPLARRILLEFR